MGFHQLHELSQLLPIVAAAGNGDLGLQPYFRFSIAAFRMDMHGFQRVYLVRKENLITHKAQPASGADTASVVF
ncbi:hypothetical protein, partial [Halomonas sp. NO4]|uniref:hypothetical protein n=1 Tax=Halomonas sp. NO4 TaxID=2484813 RepID=UPI001F09CB78